MNSTGRFLTERQKQLVEVVSELMGQNSGLYYYGLLLQPRVFEASGYRHPSMSVPHTLQRIWRKYGLSHPSIGEIVYEAVARNEVQMRVQVPVPVRPRLDTLELRILESAAKVLVPKGGFFNGYANKVAELADLSPTKAKNYRAHLTKKFNAPNIESAIISAFALGVLNPRKVFGAELPRPLAVIMGSMSYRRATQQVASGVYARTLTEAQKAVAAEFVKLIGLNSGLFWNGWEHKVASKVGKSFGSVDQTVIGLCEKFGTSNRGEMFYMASRLLEEPVVVRLPHRVEAEFKGLEHDVLVAAAKVLLSAGGYYLGYQDDIADAVHVSKSTLPGINQRIIEKTRAANLGQAISFSIAYSFIPLSQIKLDAAKVPALEAILSADRKTGAYA